MVGEEARSVQGRGKRVFTYVLLSVLFCIILCALLAVVSHILHPKNNTEEAGMMDVRTYSVLAEPENTIDALFVGNSVAATDVSPMEIWERSGYTSYVCAANGEKMTFVRYLLEQTFQKQSPQYVFIEADMFFDPCDFSHAAREVLRETFPGILYHHRWCSLTLDDFIKPIEYTNVLDAKGFNAKGLQVSLDARADMASTDEMVLPGQVNMTLMQDVVNLCQQRGAQVVVIAMPMPTSWDMAHHNGAVEACKRLGVEFIDLNREDRHEDLNINWSTDARDHNNHLNHRGAKKVSKELSTILTAHGLKDHRGDDAYAAWDESLVRYRAFMKELAERPEKYDTAGTHVG